MKNKDFEKELKKARVESRRSVTEAKDKLKKLVDYAENAIIIQTDKGSALVGNRYDGCQLLCNLFEHLLENNFTKKEIIELLNMVDDKEKSETIEATEKTLNRISELLDKAIKLEKLKNKKED